MTTVAAGIWAKKVRNNPRERRRFRATLPGSWETATSEADFAMSTATTVCSYMGSSFSLLKGDVGASMPIQSQEESISSIT